MDYKNDVGKLKEILKNWDLPYWMELFRLTVGELLDIPETDVCDNCICTECGDSYRGHPEHEHFKFIIKLCDGTYVNLPLMILTTLHFDDDQVDEDQVQLPAPDALQKERTWQEIEIGEFLQDVNFLFTRPSNLSERYFMIMSAYSNSEHEYLWKCADITYSHSRDKFSGMGIREFNTKELNQMKLVGRFKKSSLFEITKSNDHAPGDPVYKMEDLPEGD